MDPVVLKCLLFCYLSCLAEAVPAINIFSKPALNQVEVELNYEEQRFPNGFKVSVMFDPNENVTNCNDLKVLTKVLDSCTTVKSTNHKVYCDNQRPGLYCARAHELLSGGEFGRLFYTGMVPLVSVNESATKGVVLSEVRNSVPEEFGVTKIVSISLGICCSVTVLVILRLIIVRRQNNDRRSFANANFSAKEREVKSRLVDAVRNRPKVHVFLLYYPECCHHLEFIEHLTTVLTCNNCEVSYDQKEMNNIAVNAASWIQNKLSGHYKILIVNSRSAYEQQRTWLENKGVFGNEPLTNEGNIFLSALAIIMHRTKQAFDYCNVSMLRPSYVSKSDVLQNICPGIQYEVPTDLSDLICNLHELDPQSVDLKAPESELWEHCFFYYSEMARLCCAISGADATKARRFTSTIPCQICNPQTDVTSESTTKLLSM